MSVCGDRPRSDSFVVRRSIALARELIGFPRHLSQHVGGFVLTRGRLDETVPIGNAAMDDRTFIEWDKDDIDALGIMKVDVLALGMLTCIRKALRAACAACRATWPTVPRRTRRSTTCCAAPIRSACSRWKSRAQMNMLPRLRPRTFYDLVIEVAIVRPGPIQGDMVHPYLRRRQGLEKPELPSPSPEHGPPDELEQVLGKTLGVPLFQEQAMRIAIDAAKFTPEEANELRRAMATFRNAGTIHRFFAKMVDGMVGARLHAGLRRALLPPDRGLRHLRLPGKPRRQLRAAGLRLGLAEMPSPGGVRLRAAEFAADGVLCAGADRARCARAWRGGARHRCGCQRVGLHAGRRRAASGLPPDHRIFAGVGGDS